MSRLALRDPSIGWLPKALAALATLVGVLPLEWIPGIPPILVLLALPILVPAILALAWWTVPATRKRALHRRAPHAPLPWVFLALIAAIFTLSVGLDSYLDFAFPGQDAISTAIDPYIEQWFE